MSKEAFITALGKFLPGPPIGNDEMEDYLGRILGKPSRLRRRVLSQNGIVSRHYAIDKNQRSLYRNSELAAEAIRDALSRSSLTVDDIELLAAATTLGDAIAP